MIRPSLILTAAIACIFAVGCSKPHVPAEPIAEVVNIDDYEAFCGDVVSTLRACEWRMRTVDRDGGIIETQPATSAHFPEFWRLDSPGAYNYLESSLSTVRRTVTVKIAPAEPTSSEAKAPMAPTAADDPSRGIEAFGPARSALAETVVQNPAPTAQSADSAGAAVHGRYRVTVEVRKERFSTPERQITTASGALGLYSERTPTIYGYRKSRPGDVQWISLGRDPLLEADLLRRIVLDSGHVE